MQVLLHFLTWMGNLPQGKDTYITTSPPMFIFLSYPWFANTLFLCSCALSSLPPLLEFGTVHAIGDVAIPAPAFSFPLISPSKMLIGKELRPMVIPAKSWPKASEDCITWVDKLSPHFQEHWKSLIIAQFIKLTKVRVNLDLDLISTALRIWSKGLNSFLFPFGPASITMRDNSILTGLSVEGSEVV